MAQILFLHSRKNRHLADFFLRAFAATKVTPIVIEVGNEIFSYELQTQLEQAILISSATFVLLSPDIQQNEIVRNNIISFCVKASKKDIWVFELAEQFNEIKVILPFFNHYARFENTDSWANYIQAAINFYDDSNFLPALAISSGVGALLGGKDPVTGGAFGLFSGLILAGISQSQRQVLGQPKICINCSRFFRIHLTQGTKDFKCVICGTLYLEKNGIIAKQFANEKLLRQQITNEKFSLLSEHKIQMNNAMTETIETPKAFISYSWDTEEHKTWVRELAERLRKDGIDVMLDQWHLVPGDQMPEFMERAVRDNDFVLIVCTPNYKQKSDQRAGGVGYEGNIMTAELAAQMNQRKFIPVLRHSDWSEAASSWLQGKLYINLTGNSFEEGYQNLLDTLHNQRTQPPPVGQRPEPKSTKTSTSEKPVENAQAVESEQAAKKTAINIESDEPIKIKGIIEQQITKPRMDGTRGSGLYTIPFQLSRQPTAVWNQLFVENWKYPPTFTSMHRPNIAGVSGDCIILDGTTIEEVKEYHQGTLLAVVERTNEQYAEYEARQRQKDELKKRQEEQHNERLKNSINQIKFD